MAFSFIKSLHVLLVLFYHCVYSFTFCMLSFNSVSYVSLLLCLCRHPSATLTEVFPCFFLNCKANARV
jgi:hypothetical protein